MEKEDEKEGEQEDGMQTRVSRETAVIESASRKSSWVARGPKR